MRITTTNPAGGEFPGGRGADQLVLYTPAHGARTGTNAYGTEATVRGGIVEHCEGNDSPIPTDGFVLSGHGKASEWILANLRVGTEVRIEDGEVRARYTLKSKVHEIRRRLDAVSQTTAPAEDAVARAVAGARAALEAAERALAAGGQADAEPHLREADSLSRTALHAGEPSMSPEGRGLWFRVAAKSPDEMRALVERAAANHFNLLFPETIYWSTTLCPRLGPDAPRQNLAFEGWDPLEVLIEAAHARGMQVHAWCEVFFIGPGEPELARLHPDWLAVDRGGATRASAEENFRYFCPSRPEAREYLLRQLEALAAKYPLDGLQLDYIRYPVSQPLEASFCYCAHCRDAFGAAAGADPLKLSPDSDPGKWAQWVAWREERITSFVREARTRLRKARPEIVISAAVFPDIAEARGKKLQNWPAWAGEGLLDLLCMMTYFTDPAEVARLTRENMHQAAGTPVFVGLGPFLHLTEEALVRQVAEARRAGAGGQVMFCEEAMTPGQFEALTAGPFRRPAAIPGLAPRKH